MNASYKSDSHLPKEAEETGMDDLAFSRAARLVWVIGPPFLLLFGTFGNSMSIVVHHRLSRKGKSTVSVYLIALAVSDQLLLYSGLLVQWLSNILGYKVTSVNNVACKLLPWFIYTSGALCAWLLVAVTLQRALSVVWPHRVSSLVIIRRSLNIVLCLASTLMLIHVHILYGWGTVVIDSSNDTFMQDCGKVNIGYLNFFDRIWSWFDMLVFSLIPFTILLASNTVLLKTVVTSVREARHRLSVGNKQQVVSRQKTASSMTLTLMVLSFTFILLTGPVCVYLLTKPYVFGDVNADIRKEAVRRFVFAVMDLLWYINSAINFYLYCLSGSKFRSELRGLFAQSKEKNGGSCLS